MMMKIDWQEVADRRPQGYLELNNGKQALYGPIERVEVKDGNVEIYLKWAASRPLGQYGIPSGKWEIVDREALLIAFPNEMVPFIIESTPDKGHRVRFNTLNILYFNNVAKFTLEQIQAEILAA